MWGTARFLATIRAASVQDRLGCSVKKKPAGTAVTQSSCVSVCGSTKTVKPAGLTQLATEGIEQLDTYLFFLPAAVFLRHALFGSLTLLCCPALYFKKKL